MKYLYKNYTGTKDTKVFKLVFEYTAELPNDFWVADDENPYNIFNKPLDEVSLAEFAKVIYDDYYQEKFFNYADGPKLISLELVEAE